MATSNSQTGRLAHREALTQKQQILKKQSEIHADRESLYAASVRQRVPVGAVAVIMSVCLALGGVLGLNAYRNELSYDILHVEKELTEAQSQYVTMQNQLDAQAAKLGRDAATLGMQEAKQSQMHYIDLVTENKIEVVGEMSVWDKISAFFSGLFHKE